MTRAVKPIFTPSGGPDRVARRAPVLCVAAMALLLCTTPSLAQDACSTAVLRSVLETIEQTNAYEACDLREITAAYDADVANLITATNLIRDAYNLQNPDYAVPPSAGEDSDLDKDLASIRAHLKTLSELDWSGSPSDAGRAGYATAQDKAVEICRASFQGVRRVFGGIAQLTAADFSNGGKVSFCSARLSWRKARAWWQRIKVCWKEAPG